MKKITLIAALALTTLMTAQTTITHSDSQDITPGITVACPTEPTQYLRVFDLVNEFSIAGAFEISTVEFGVEVAETVATTLNIYTSDSIDPTDAGGATLTTVYTVDLDLAGTEGTVVSHTLPTSVVVPAGSIIVMELAEASDGTVFRIGANQAGETAESWLKSETCGEGTVTSFGFVNHYVMNVIGDEILGFNDNLLSQVSIFPNPATDVLNVSIPSDVTVKSSSLFDVLGKDTGLKLANGTINTSNLARGVYILNINTDKGSLTEKIVKQ